MSWPPTDEPPPDEEILTRLRAGDREALRVLFRRHMPVVYGAAYVVTGSAADAEENAQDAFFLLWEKRLTVSIVGDSLLPWLIATTRFHAANRRRASKRKGTVPLLDSLDSPTADATEAAAISHELQRRLTVAIEQMSEIDQAIIDACLVDGMSYEKAAASFGVSHGTLRNRLSRAKIQLRLQLASERNGS